MFRHVTLPNPGVSTGVTPAAGFYKHVRRVTISKSRKTVDPILGTHESIVIRTARYDFSEYTSISMLEAVFSFESQRGDHFL